MSWIIPPLLFSLSFSVIKSNANLYKTKNINENESHLKINSSNSDQQAFHWKMNGETPNSFRHTNGYSDHREIVVCVSKLVYPDIWDKQNIFSKIIANLDKNCTHVIGNVIIAHITNEDLKFLNSIEEITGFLFLYSNSIESISMKKLRIIRGENPWIYKEVKWSLIVIYNFFEGNMLKYLILPSFQVVSRHNILIYNNPGLLYFKYKINWNSLIGKNQNVEIVKPKNSSSIYFERSGPLDCHSSCQLYAGKQFCWGQKADQCQIINDCITKSCKITNKCFYQNELKVEQCCHEECVGGCYGPLNNQCMTCKHVINQGTCVEKCPRKLVHNGVKRIKNPMGKFTFHNTCVDKCPDNYFIENTKCVPKCTEGVTYAVNDTCLPCPNRICPKVCFIEDVVKNYNIPYLNRKMLARLEKCTVYQGNVVINNLSIEGDSENGWPKDIYGIQANDLEKLTNLKEIYGYVEINVGSKAPWLISLLYLRNLHIIRAESINPRTSSGLSIIHNNDLVFLGLQKLKEVRNGKVVIANNTKLCFTDSLVNESISHTSQILISNNGKNGKCENRKCSKLCNPKYGCWGPMGMFCVKCRNFQIAELNMCISSCSKQPGYFFDERNHQNHEKQCSKCHNQCLPINNTCYGPGANQCIFGCINYKYKEYCVEKCPQNHYGGRSTLNICKACHPSCTKENLYSFKESCTGTNNHVGLKGCRNCNYVQLQSNGSNGFNNKSAVYLLTCLQSSDECLNGYYKTNIDFHSLENVTSLLKLYSNNSLLKETLGNWIDRQTNRESQFGSICLPCHPLCSQCSNGTIESCRLCKYLRLGDKCTQNCNEGDDIVRNETTGERRCLKCHEECLEGCSGSTEYDCKQCKRVTIYLNSSKTKFFCNSICGDNFRIFVNSEMICIQPSALTQIQTSWFIVAVVGAVVMVLFIGIIWKCIWLSLNKRKSYDLKPQYHNGFSPANIENDILVSSTKLLMIPKNQRVCKGIINLGTFRIVDKGSWTPKLEYKDGRNSCLKECLFHALPEKSVKLNVTIKVLFDCEDLADNKDFTNELKLITSTDPPCNLRIMAVLVATQEEFSSQSLPVGSLLEFFQLNSSVIDDISLFLWAHQVSKGFGNMKYEGIIHCDVETSNAKMESPLLIEISDLGLSRLSNTCSGMKQLKEGQLSIRWSLMENCNNQVFSSALSYDCNHYPITRLNFKELKQSIEMMMKNPSSYIILQINGNSPERQITIVNGLHDQVTYNLETDETSLPYIKEIKNNKIKNHINNKEKQATTFNYHLEFPGEIPENPTSHNEGLVNNIMLRSRNSI